MKTINFKEFDIWQNIDKKTATEDARYATANTMYQSMRGIAYHDLAFRILRSDGPMKLSPNDETMLTEFFNQCAESWMYGSYLRNINDMPDEN